MQFVSTCNWFVVGMFVFEFESTLLELNLTSTDRRSIYRYFRCFMKQEEIDTAGDCRFPWGRGTSLCENFSEWRFDTHYQPYRKVFDGVDVASKTSNTHTQTARFRYVHLFLPYRYFSHARQKMTSVTVRDVEDCLQEI